MKSNIGSYISIVIIGLFLFFLQTSIFNPVPWFNIPINFLFVFSLCLSSFSNITQRIVITLYCGLLIDLWFSSCSSYTISLIIVNSLVSSISLRTQVDSVFILISTVIGTLFIELINAAFLGFCLYNTPFNPFIIYQHSIIKLVIGNAIFALIIFPFIKRQFFVKTGFGRY